MDNIIFENLKPLLNYFPIKVGKAEIFYRDGGSFGKRCFVLHIDGVQWNLVNTDYYGEIKEFFLDINLSTGKVVTTGLGFGILQTILCQKPDVTEVIVYEKHEEIIEIFLKFVEKSNFNISKLKIINKDARESINEECQWLCMDHFELHHQTSWEIIDQVREISNNCKATNVMFWPLYCIYNEFCYRKQMQYDQNSYSYFREMIRIDKLPKNIDTDLLNKFNYWPLRFNNGNIK